MPQPRSPAGRGRARRRGRPPPTEHGSEADGVVALARRLALAHDLPPPWLVGGPPQCGSPLRTPAVVQAGHCPPALLETGVDELVEAVEAAAGDGPSLRTPALPSAWPPDPLPPLPPPDPSPAPREPLPPPLASAAPIPPRSPEVAIQDVIVSVPRPLHDAPVPPLRRRPEAAAPPTPPHSSTLDAAADAATEYTYVAPEEPPKTAAEEAALVRCLLDSGGEGRRGYNDRESGVTASTRSSAAAEARRRQQNGARRGGGDDARRYDAEELGVTLRPPDATAAPQRVPDDARRYDADEMGVTQQLEPAEGARRYDADELGRTQREAGRPEEERRYDAEELGVTRRRYDADELGVTQPPAEEQRLYDDDELGATRRQPVEDQRRYDDDELGVTRRVERRHDTAGARREAELHVAEPAAPTAALPARAHPGGEAGDTVAPPEQPPARTPPPWRRCCTAAAEAAAAASARVPTRVKVGAAAALAAVLLVLFVVGAVALTRSLPEQRSCWGTSVGEYAQSAELRTFGGVRLLHIQSVAAAPAWCPGCVAVTQAPAADGSSVVAEAAVIVADVAGGSASAALPVPASMGQASFIAPLRSAVGPRGDVWVPDPALSQVLRLEYNAPLPARVSLAVGTIGTPGAGAGQLSSPVATAANAADGRVAVADAGNCRAAVLSSLGTVLTAVGGCGVAGMDFAGAADLAMLNDSLYVATADTVSVVGVTAGTVTSAFGTSPPTGLHSLARSLRGSSWCFKSVAVAQQGHLLVLEGSQVLVRAAADGAVQCRFGDFTGAVGAAVLADRRIVVAERDRLLVYSTA